MGSISSDAPEGEGFPIAYFSSSDSSSSGFSGGKVSSPSAASPMKGGDLDSLEMDSFEKIIHHWEADNLRFKKKVAALKLIVSRSSETHCEFEKGECHTEVESAQVEQGRKNCQRWL